MPKQNTSRLAINLLAFIMFVIVCTEFVVIGLLPMMAQELQLTLGEAGRLITCFALGASLLGPVLTLFAARYDPVYFLLITILFFACANFIIALTSSYSLVMAMRIVQGCLLPAIISLVAVEAVRLAGTGKQGWAIARVNLGVAATTVVGIPLSVMIAETLAWSSSFLILGVLGLISAGLMMVWIAPDKQNNNQQASIIIKQISVFELLQRPIFLLHLVLSCALFTGMFSSYSYIAALLTHLANIDQDMLGWALMGFGIAGILGNWLCGRVVDKDPLKISAWVALILAFSMVILVPAAESLLTLMLLVVLWGAAHMAAFVVCQVRVMNAGHGAAAFALSLNISACNLGIALGAFVGGKAVTNYGVASVAYLAAAGIAVALFITVMLIVKRHVHQKKSAHQQKSVHSKLANING